MSKPRTKNSHFHFKKNKCQAWILYYNANRKTAALFSSSPVKSTRACFPKPDYYKSKQKQPLFLMQEPLQIASYRLVQPISRLWTQGQQEYLLPPLERLQNYPQLADQRCLQVFKVEVPRSSRISPVLLALLVLCQLAGTQTCTQTCVRVKDRILLAATARIQSLIPALFLEQLITGLLTLKSLQAPLDIWSFISHFGGNSEA